VHGATLLDGTPVVVKVQRPTIRQQVHQDLQVMAAIAPLLVGRIPIAALANPPALVVAGLTVIDPLVAVSIGIIVLGEAALRSGA